MTYRDFIKAFIFLMFVTSNAMAGGIPCPVNMLCEKSHENKIEASLARARIVVFGSFHPKGADFLSAIKQSFNGRSFLRTDFVIEKAIKGPVLGDRITFEIAMYSLPKLGTPIAVSDIKENEFNYLINTFGVLEEDLERGKVSRGNYVMKISDTRDKLRSHQNYSKTFVILPINAGGFDSSYRIADVPVFSGNKYILFIMHDIIKNNVTDINYTTLYEGDFDLYASEQLDKIQDLYAKQLNRQVIPRKSLW